MICLNVAKALEAEGKTGNVVILDGSPLSNQKFAEYFVPADKSEDFMKNEILKGFVHSSQPQLAGKLIENFLTSSSFDENHQNISNTKPFDELFKTKFPKTLVETLVNRLIMMSNVDLDSFPLLESTDVTLITSEDLFASELPLDFGLSRYFSKDIKVLKGKGHLNLLGDAQLLRLLRRFHEKRTSLNRIDCSSYKSGENAMKSNTNYQEQNLKNSTSDTNLSQRCCCS